MGRCKLGTTDVLRGDYVPQARGVLHDGATPASANSPPADEITELLTYISMKLSRWMFRVELDASRQALPPDPQSYTMKSGSVFDVFFAVVHFTLADSREQGQR